MMMKKTLAVLLIASMSVLAAGCGHELETAKKTYPTYGFFNQDKYKSDDVCYEVSVGNVLLSVLLIESVIGPVYFVGFSLFNPIRLKSGPTDNCKAV
jgi:hypothetical protein